MKWQELQSLFKEAVVRGDRAVLGDLNSGPEHLPAATGIKVYRDAYFLRMREYLEDDFPKTFAAWKEAERRAIVRSYAAKFPSCSPTAADFGARFPGFLADRKWAPGLCHLPDLAALEWALVRARNAPAPVKRGFERLNHASEGDLARARFHFDPAMSFVDSEWPLFELYDHPTGVSEKGFHRFLAYRESGEASFRPLEEGEREWLEALSTGITLGELCEKAGAGLDSDTFADWVEGGLLMEIEWEIPLSS